MKGARFKQPDIVESDLCVTGKDKIINMGNSGWNINMGNSGWNREWWLSTEGNYVERFRGMELFYMILEW